MKIKSPFDKESISPEMTSLIDIMFLLIIFFMITTTFDTSGKQRRIQVELPHAQFSTPIHRSEACIIGVGERGEFYLGEKPCDPAKLADGLATQLALTRDSTVVISADKKAPYGAVVFIYDIFQSLGIRKFSHEVR
jgi:biopolymer transport protein ExbD